MGFNSAFKWLITYIQYEMQGNIFGNSLRMAWKEAVLYHIWRQESNIFLGTGVKLQRTYTYPKMPNTTAMLIIRKKSQYILPFSCIYLASWTRVLPEKLKLLQIDKNLPTFNGNRRLIIVFTAVRKLSLSCAKLMQSTPHLFYLSLLKLTFNCDIPVVFYE